MTGTFVRALRHAGRHHRRGDHCRHQCAAPGAADIEISDTAISPAATAATKVLPANLLLRRTLSMSCLPELRIMNWSTQGFPIRFSAVAAQALSQPAGAASPSQPRETVDPADARRSDAGTRAVDGGAGSTAGSSVGSSVAAAWILSLIHISEPTRRTPISYAV